MCASSRTFAPSLYRVSTDALIRKHRVEVDYKHNMAHITNEILIPDQGLQHDNTINCNTDGTVQDGMTQMSESERSIFNRLGASSSSKNKLTYSELGLRGRADKKGVMWKTGPMPSWYTSWRKRCFVLKGNFLYYFEGDTTYDDPPVLGAIFIKNAIIEKTSMSFATYVLSVSPIVRRRVNWEGEEESSIFYLKFKSEESRMGWFDVLHKVSFGSA